ncbi:MAG: hypothetical protein FWG99_08215 [Treponema sp.]|nr:hypothetical protein [Treponema sp.]
MSTHNKAIGTYKESSLHRTLKFQYSGRGGRIETQAGGYIADGMNALGELIEVQTGSFAPLKAKVKEFVCFSRVRIIHPVAINKHIEVFEARSGVKPIYRRKSPVKGSVWNLFDALLFAPELPLIPGVSIEVVLVSIVEKRVRDGRGSWRRKGVSIMDRELVTWHESVVLEKKSDYLQFVPFEKNEIFTSSELVEKTGIDADLARKALYVLTKLKVVERIGKEGRRWLYKRINVKKAANRNTASCP